MGVFLDAHKLSYISVPKIATTSFHRLFFEIENGQPFRPFTANGKRYYISNFYRSTPFEKLDTAAMADHTRLALVCDPVRRLLSCYSNRVVHHRELSPQKARRRLAQADLPPDPDLASFIAKLPAYCAAVPSIGWHARPMVDFLGPDPAFYTRLYRIEDSAGMLAEIHRLTGSDVALKRSQTGGPKIDPDTLSAAQIARLRDFYAQDYEVYGRHV